MNRNTELHFSKVPQINIRRSKFDLSHSHKTTFNTGDVIPLMVDPDILPGDTVQMDMAELVRMSTPIFPIMDNLYFDIYWFFVPHRLVWEHWQEFWGENNDPWTQQTEYEVPQITAPEGGWSEGTLADYMGVPTKVPNIQANALMFRAYAKIWNDWMRSENLKKCCHIYQDETTRQGTNGTGDYVLDVELGGMPAKAAKMHDYFTSALPSPSKGPEVSIPLTGTAPVTGNIGTMPNWPVQPMEDYIINTPQKPIAFKRMDGNNFLNNQVLGLNITTPSVAEMMMGEVRTGTSTTPDTFIPNTTDKIYPANLYAITDRFNVGAGLTADLSRASATTIAALRMAFALQQYYENAGRAGTRYIEYIRSVFGVSSSDARFQRAEYLGGQRVPLNIDQIVQTSSTDSTSPQGNTAGFSCTLNNASMFTKSFEEHGTLMCLGVVRTEHTYQQGLPKAFTRKKWTDFYNPYFQSLSEMPILNENIYAQGTTEDKEAFGYQEAWAEYRYKPSYITGYMRSNANGSLDVWHFADDYDSLPILGTTWIDEPYENVDRTIAVTSQKNHQFIADIYFKCYYTRPMPVYSIPGGLDRI